MQTKQRLNAYAALAAGVAGSASADITGQTGLNIIVTPSSPASIDFGPGFGEVFEFSILESGGVFTNTSFNTYSTIFTRSSFLGRSDLMGFKGNAPWTRASNVGYSSFYPMRLGQNVDVDPTNPNFNQMNGDALFQFAYYSNYSNRTITSYGGSFQSSFFGSGAWGEWAQGLRGFVGVRFTDNDTDFYHAWFDIEVDYGGWPMIIHGWGLNRTANEGIMTGQIPTPGAGALAMLAAGAAGIRRTRRAS